MVSTSGTSTSPHATRCGVARVHRQQGKPRIETAQPCRAPQHDHPLDTASRRDDERGCGEAGAHRGMVDRGRLAGPDPEGLSHRCHHFLLVAQGARLLLRQPLRRCDRADTATRVSANPQPRSHSAGLLRSERQLRPPFNYSDWFRKDDDVRWQAAFRRKGLTS